MRNVQEGSSSIFLSGRAFLHQASMDECNYFVTLTISAMFHGSFGLMGLRKHTENQKVGAGPSGPVHGERLPA